MNKEPRKWDEGFDKEFYTPEEIEASDKRDAQIQKQNALLQAEELTMKEIAETFEVPYNIVVDAAWDMRNGKRQRGHNVKYNVTEIKPYLLNRINAKIDSAEEKLDGLRAMKRNIELAGTEVRKE